MFREWPRRVPGSLCCDSCREILIGRLSSYQEPVREASNHHLVRRPMRQFPDRALARHLCTPINRRPGWQYRELGGLSYKMKLGKATICIMIGKSSSCATIENGAIA